MTKKKGIDGTVKALNLGDGGCSAEEPCDIGEGDCFDDDQCKCHLKCRERNYGEDVPGVSFPTNYPYKYDVCYDPYDEICEHKARKADGTVDVADKGEKGCSPDKPCDIGEGDCDSDEDCKCSLKCF